MHRCPTFVRAARLPSSSLSSVRTHCRTSLVGTAVYICMRCLTAVNIANLHSCALQNLVGMHCCPTFIHAARLPSTSLTSVCTCCRISLVCTAVYICTRCLSAVNIAILHSHALENPICMCHCPTFVRAARLLSFSTLYYFTYLLLLWPHFR